MKLSKNAKILLLVFVVTLGVFALSDVTGKVISASSFCGNSVCEVGEGPANCPSDCVSMCGDGLCQASEKITCKQDCSGFRVVEIKGITLRDGLLQLLS